MGCSPLAQLEEMGAAGCNLEDTNHAAGELSGPAEQADWLFRLTACHFPGKSLKLSASSSPSCNCGADRRPSPTAA
jgi:hypothetical protein